MRYAAFAAASLFACALLAWALWKLPLLPVVGGVAIVALAAALLALALRRRADERVELLAAALEQIPDGLVVTSVDGTIEHANDAFLRSVGYSRSDLGSLNAADLTQSAYASHAGQIVRAVRDAGVWRGTLTRRRRDGSAYPASCTVVGLRSAAGELTHLVGVERDLTDELTLRDQLVHTERLSAIGELVAGVAHELNNPLQTILGSAEVLLEEQTVPGGRRELELVRREASRAAQIVRNLLAFVRRSTPDRVVGDLNHLVSTTIELRQYHLERSNIVVDVALHPQRLPVFANREEIQQVVLNLVLNAEQALLACHGGRIGVRTFARGGSHVVEVADDGPGVDKELRGKIFEPFFTTKEVGQGTGLGLSISHGIALAHGGSLELVNQPSRGACFQLTLPAYHEPAEAEPLPAEPRAGRGVALVVDDEVSIRRVLCRLLEKRGLEVIEAQSGAQALDAARDGRLALVLCDIRMPRMNGVELYSQLCAAAPALRHRFVFMSGDPGQARASGLSDDVPILHKPFTAADLDAVLEKTQL